jgi:hypothetical protein
MCREKRHCQLPLAVTEGLAEESAACLAVHMCRFDNVAQSGRCSYTWLTDEQ